VNANPHRTTNHLGYLDGLRAVAALCVVATHAWLQIWPFIYNHLPKGWTWKLTGGLLFGHFAVDLFIVLSGFCLMLPIVRGDGTLRGGVRHFFLKRARRILPPYYLGMGFSLLLIGLLVGQKTGTHWDLCVPVGRRDILVHLLLLQDALQNSKINHAYWSIPVEWRIYFAFPLLVVGWKRFGSLVTTLLAFAVAYGLYFALRNTAYIGTTPWYLASFTMGIFAADIAYGTTRRCEVLRAYVPWGMLAAASAGIVAAICCRWAWTHTFASFAGLDFLASLGVLSLLVAASRPHVLLHRLLSWRPLVFLGTFAYSVYLIHAPLLQVIWQYLLHPLHLGDVETFLLLILLGIPAILGVSYLFFLICERPFLVKRRGEPMAETEREAALSPAP